jgi:hypothetical protein
MQCAAVAGMHAGGVGLDVKQPMENYKYELDCSADDINGEAYLKYSKASTSPREFRSPGTAANLLNDCGKQLRIVEETDQHEIADLCPHHNRVQTGGDKWICATDASGGDMTPAAGKCLEAVLTGETNERTQRAIADLVVTDCDDDEVNQRFVFTTPAEGKLGYSGQLVSLMEPAEGSDGSKHLWCVEITEKVDDDASTTFMQYRVDWCATDHTTEEELYCSGHASQSTKDENHLPFCQTFRSNRHWFGSQQAVSADPFKRRARRTAAPAFQAPPANIFSYVQPMTYKFDIAGTPEEISKKLGIAWEEDTKTEEIDATAETLEGMRQYLSANVNAEMRVQAILVLEEQSRVEFDVRTRSQAAFDVGGATGKFEKASGLTVTPGEDETVACGPGETCGFLYFQKEATIYHVGTNDVDGSRRSIHDCTADAPCKYEMMYEPPNGKHQRLPHHTYHICHSNAVGECSTKN